MQLPYSLTQTQSLQQFSPQQPLPEAHLVLKEISLASPQWNEAGQARYAYLKASKALPISVLSPAAKQKTLDAFHKSPNPSHPSAPASKEKRTSLQPKPPNKGTTKISKILQSKKQNEQGHEKARLTLNDVLSNLEHEGQSRFFPPGRTQDLRQAIADDPYMEAVSSQRPEHSAKRLWQVFKHQQHNQEPEWKSLLQSMALGAGSLGLLSFGLLSAGLGVYSVVKTGGWHKVLGDPVLGKCARRFRSSIPVLSAGAATLGGLGLALFDSRDQIRQRAINLRSATRELEAQIKKHWPS